MKRALKRGVAIADSQQRDERFHDGLRQRCLELLGRVVMPVDVTTFARTAQQVEIVGAGQQPDVVDLRDSRQEALDRPRDQIFGITAAEGVLERAVDLGRVEVAGGAAARESALVAAPQMDRFYQRVNRLLGQ